MCRLIDYRRPKGVSKSVPVHNVVKLAGNERLANLKAFSLNIYNIYSNMILLASCKSLVREATQTQNCQVSLYREDPSALKVVITFDGVLRKDG